MLIVTRNENESLAIGANVVVSVVAIRAHHVKLAIEAPRVVSILRDDAIECRVHELSPLVPLSVVDECLERLIADGFATPDARERVAEYVAERLEVEP